MNREQPPVHSSLFLGKSVLPVDQTGEWTVQSPTDSSIVLSRFVYSYSQIELAVGLAAKNQPRWRKLAFSERMKILKAAFDKVRLARDSLIKIAEEELGRTSSDLELEWKQLEKWITGFETLESCAGQPRGVTAYIGSSAWPIFYSIQFIFLNLLVGNSVVVKPSERATLTTLALGQLITAIEPLQSQVQILVGEKEVGRRLACHESVQTVIFMGTFEVGMRIKQDTLGQPSKEVLLYLSSKNASVIRADSDPLSAQFMGSILQDCFLSSGQHCRSVSVIFVHQAHYRAFTDGFVERAKHYAMGSLFAQDRYLKFSAVSEREGASLAMRGKPLSTSANRNSATPTIALFSEMTAERMKKSVSLQTEISSPHVSVIQYLSDDELIEIVQQMQHGLGITLWGSDLNKLKQLASQFQVGQIQFNQSMLEWDPCVSFQAQKKSGNHAYHGLKLIEQVTTLKDIG